MFEKYFQSNSHQGNLPQKEREKDPKEKQSKKIHMYFQIIFF